MLVLFKSLAHFHYPFIHVIIAEAYFIENPFDSWMCPPKLKMIWRTGALCIRYQTLCILPSIDRLMFHILPSLVFKVWLITFHLYLSSFKCSSIVINVAIFSEAVVVLYHQLSCYVGHFCTWRVASVRNWWYDTSKSDRNTWKLEWGVLVLKLQLLCAFVFRKVLVS